MDVAVMSRAPRARRRWELWTSPDGQPGWARPGLLLVAGCAAVLYGHNIRQAGFEGFYSVAVKSMSVSWKAFVFGAFDPKATITLDKLAGSFVPQAISARIFGFHAWSLALPQVIEGVISVLVMYRVVRRWAGPAAGLLAAGLFALTPVAVSMFGHSMEDGALTMCLVLAADCCQRAMAEGRRSSLLWAAFWVGAGFQAKMLQAWIVLPALAAGYLYAAPVPLRRRIADLAGAGVAALAVSLSWIALYTLVPAADRPYIDGSTSNSAAAMVFGYNGLGRFGISVPGSVGSMFGGGHGGGLTSGPAGRALAELGRGGGLDHAGGGWGKLAGPEFGPQIGWLFPLALAALACGLLWCRRDRARLGGYALWGTWLVSFGFVFSAMKVVPHTAYVASLAPALAALAAAGIVAFTREYRAGTRRGWLLPAAAAAELAWSAYLWRPYRDFFPAARWTIMLAGALAVGILVAARLTRGRNAVVAVATVTAAAVMVAAPAAWAGSALEPRYDGNEMNATAGPPPRGGIGHFAASLEHMLTAGGQARGGAVPAFRGWGGASATLDGQQRAVYRYVSAHRGGASYLMAAQSWTSAAPYIVATGAEVMPMGGFSGSVPSPTLGRVRHLVATGQLRWFLLGPDGTGLLGRAPQGQVKAITDWVRATCQPAPHTLYRCPR